MQTPTEEKKRKTQARTDEGGRLVVDPEQIRALVELMSEHHLTEILLKAGDDEIRLARHVATASAGHGPAVAPVQHVVPVASETVAAAPAPAAAEQPAVDESLLPVVSPMVGTFYASPDPQAPPFVNVGTHVNKGTVVGIVEAMKVFNEITAGLSGTIVEVLVRNEEPVEYGHSLFMVKPD